MVYTKTNDYSENIIIKRAEYCNVRYNTAIPSEENSDVIVITENSIRRLKKLDENVINPKPMLIFGKRRDPRKHTVFIINKAQQDGMWGGNVQYIDFKTNGIQEQINIRARFTFYVERGDRCIHLLSESKQEYSKKYLLDKIRNLIGGTIKSTVSTFLNAKGFIKVQEELTNISEIAMNAINENILSQFGITISCMNLIIEEDEEHDQKRRLINWKQFEEKEKINNDQFI